MRLFYIVMVAGVPDFLDFSGRDTRSDIMCAILSSLGDSGTDAKHVGWSLHMI